ncbi:MAG: histidine--tRNA ligase [Candidatus Baldrarchaeia archaeon]
MKEFRTLRGMRDFLPRDMIKREKILRIIRKVFESYGFEPLETPAIEYWEVLSRKCGEDVEKQIFKFKDKGGRDVGLRFDLTVPFARVVAQNPYLPKPFKRYCISRVWRYERPQTGRYREFWQADADIAGSPLPDADAEVIAVGVDALKALGLSNIEVRLNNRKILEGMALKAGVPSDKVLDVFRSIDKLDKIGLEGVMEELSLKGIPKEVSEKLLEFISINGENMEVLEKARNLLKGSKIGEEGIEELISILDILEAYDARSYVKIDLSIVRGLDYYTGPIFEYVLKESPSGEQFRLAIAGGGRYDNLIELYGGSHVPATGVSLGVERIMEILEGSVLEDEETLTKVYVIPVKEEVRLEAMRIAQKLRRENIPTDIDLMRRKLDKSLEYADKRGIPFVIIVGPKDLKEGYVVLRDMKTRLQEKINVSKVVEVVKDKIQ